MESLVQVLRFGIENVGCFRDYTEVSFVATSQRDEPSFRLAASPVKHGVLPVLGVYGANASGKTRLLEALLRIRDHVRLSFSLQPNERIPWAPFRMERGTDAPPSRFDIDFLMDGVRYHYGFVHNGERFLEEWLRRWPTHRPQVLFERNAMAEEPWYFGPALTGEKVALSKATRPNSLFVSTAAQNNHPLLGAIHQALTGGIRQEAPIDLSGHPLFVAGSPILDPARRDQITAVLRAFDVGCIGFEAEEFSSGPLPQNLGEILKPEALEAFQKSAQSERPLYQVRLVRESEAGQPWTLPPEFESRGTNVLLQRINDLLSIESGVLVLDELDTSLHPDVCAAFLQLFTSRDANGRGVQLLFSTHDRGLLRHLRRDEVVLVEKRPDGSSTVSTAADFADIRGRSDLRALHEQGRLGAVPVVGDLRVIWG